MREDVVLCICGHPSKNHFTDYCTSKRKMRFFILYTNKTKYPSWLVVDAESAEDALEVAERREDIVVGCMIYIFDKVPVITKGL